MAHPELNLPPPFDDLLREHERAVMHLCLRLVHDRDDALDLFQEVWLRAYRAYPRLTADSNPRAWLFAIAANSDRNRRRDRMRRERVLAPSDPAVIAAGESAAAQDPGPLALHLRQAIEQLPEHQRKAFVMRKLGGLEYEQIAAELDCSNATARTHVFAALRKIKAGWQP